ncbi:hypothetical protein [Amaricoccus sp.]|uniref:hypothetical protein n=1 Tax=Amaricoccus sp. TaxID=1872485 RepID=UPI001B5D162D|nr:hypothetical protein [Amaricoccus sp.]MBP7002918.1 hypothetical protein [Amaricoccus sp.]
MGAEICQWRKREAAVLDTTRITLLRRSLGDQRAREILEETAFHLSDRLALLAAARAAGNRAEARASASRIAAMGEQVGLESFARTARDLDACLACGDPIAEAAVAARLDRLAEDSLYSLVAYAEHSAL